VYEVWHVRVPPIPPSRLSPTPLTMISSGNVEEHWIPRISPADATVHPSLHRGWLLHQRRGGFVGVCRSVSFPSFPSFSQCVRVLMRIDTKSASGGRHRSQRRIILWDTPRCTPSTVFQTRSAFD
jgi:hypothetical protein